LSEKIDQCNKAAAGWAGYGCYFATSDALQWRLPLALQAIAPVLLLLVGSPSLPEAPRWLSNKNCDTESVSVNAHPFVFKLHSKIGEDIPFLTMMSQSRNQIFRSVEATTGFLDHSGVSPPSVLLDTLFPGFSLLTTTLKRYSGIDVSIYFPAFPILGGIIWLSRYVLQ